MLCCKDRRDRRQRGVQACQQSAKAASSSCMHIGRSTLRNDTLYFACNV